MPRKKKVENAGTKANKKRQEDAMMLAMQTIMRRMMGDDSGAEPMYPNRASERPGDWVLYPERDYLSGMQVKDRNSTRPYTADREVLGNNLRWPVQGIPLPPKPGTNVPVYGSGSPSQYELYTPYRSLPEPQSGHILNRDRINGPGRTGPVVEEYFRFLPNTL